MLVDDKPIAQSVAVDKDGKISFEHNGPITAKESNHVFLSVTVPAATYWHQLRAEDSAGELVFLNEEQFLGEGKLQGPAIAVAGALRSNSNKISVCICNDRLAPTSMKNAGLQVSIGHNSTRPGEDNGHYYLNVYLSDEHLQSIAKLFLQNDVEEIILSAVMKKGLYEEDDYLLELESPYFLRPDELGIQTASGKISSISLCYENPIKKQNIRITDDEQKLFPSEIEPKSHETHKHQDDPLLTAVLQLNNWLKWLVVLLGVIAAKVVLFQ